MWLGKLYAVQHWLTRHYVPLLLLICLFAFVTRIYRIDEIKSYIFDEVYHTVTVKLIARDDPRAYEWWNPPIEPNTAVDWLHPPLAKYTQALGVKVFGENPLGWRISAVLFGTLAIWLTAELARAIFRDRQIALIAAALAASDGLLLVQSRIAMNDIHVTVMLLLTFWAFAWYRQKLERVSGSPKKLQAARASLRKRLFLSTLLAGLAMGTKWSGLFGLVVIWFFEVTSLLRQRQAWLPVRAHWPALFFEKALLLVVVPFAVYVLSYSHMFWQGKSLVCTLDYIKQGQCYCSNQPSAWVSLLQTATFGVIPWERLEARAGCTRLISHFSELHQQIFWYQTTLKATHDYQSRPWQWFFNLRPVWMYVQYSDQRIANIYAQGNPALFGFGVMAVVGTVVTLGYQLRRLNRAVLARIFSLESELGRLFYLAVIYFAVWLPWTLSPRIMFFYHYTPAVPLLAIIIAYWLRRIWQHSRRGRWLAVLVVVITLSTFGIFYPNWTGWPVDTEFAQRVYFFFRGWK